jgi:hypothetical protein
MVCPQVADGGDGLQIWRVTTNILNKHLRKADDGWSSSLDIERGSNNSSAQQTISLRNITQDLEIGWFHCNDLGGENWI